MQKFTKFALSLVMALFAIVANAGSRVEALDFANLPQTFTTGGENVKEVVAGDYTIVCNNGSVQLTENGFVTGGSSSKTTRHIYFTAKEDGQLDVVAAPSDDNTERYVFVATEAGSNPQAESVIAKQPILTKGQAETLSVSIEKDQTYYICVKGNATISAVSCTYSVEGEVLPTLVIGEDEYNLNDHSDESVLMAEQLKVRFVDLPEVCKAEYVINEMELVDGAWVPAAKVISGELSINTIGYAEFATLVFQYGKKYQLSITTYENPYAPQVLKTYTYGFNGSYEINEANVVPALIIGEDEVTLNTHSAVSVLMAESLKVNFENMPEVIGASYAINEMNLGGDDEGMFWTVGKELAVGEMSVKGIGYAELGKTLTFDYGKRYQLAVTAYANPADPTEIGVTYYEFNGSYEAETPAVIPAFVLGEEETTLNTHSNVSVSNADALQITVENMPQIIGATYLINEMVQNVDEEGTFWTVGAEIAAGEMSIKGKGISEFKENMIFNAGTKYQLTVRPVAFNGDLEQIVYEFNGSYVEAPVIEPVLIGAGEEVALNGHSEVSVASAEEILLNVDNIVLGEASYKISTLVNVVGEESSSWEVNETIAEGQFDIHGRAYAALAEALTFNYGEKYQIAITYKEMGSEESETIAYNFNGSTVAPVITDIAVISGQEQITLNTHSEASVEAVDAVAMSFGYPVDVKEASYVLSIMNEVVGEESSTWEAGDPIIQGAVSINTRGYIAFDEPIVLEQGSKYQLSINVINHDGTDETVAYIINGAYVAPVITEVTINQGENATVLNTHSDASIEAIDAIQVNFGTPASVKEATYAINAMTLVAGEESSSWEVASTVAEGNISINTRGYVELETPVILEQGTKYQLVIKVANFDGTTDEAVYGIDGATVIPTITETALIVGEEQIALNDHSDASVEVANGIKVSFGKPVDVKEATYVLNSMVQIDGNESSSWEVNETIAEGNVSINTIGFADFEEPVVFEQGTKYQLTIKVTNFDGTEETAVYGINGATVAPVIAEVALIASEEQIALNDHSDVSVESADAIKVTFGNPTEVKEATYVLNSMIQVVGEESSSWVENETIAKGDVSINTIGYVAFEEPVVFEQGTKYQLTIKVTNLDGSEETAVYGINGATAAPEVAEFLLINGEEQISLNNHSSASVEKINAVKVTFGNPVDVKEAKVAIMPLVPVVTEEATTYVPGVPTLYDLSINTIGYAEINKTFEQGTKYQINLDITYLDGSESTVSYVIDGATEVVVPSAAVVASGDKDDVKLTFECPDVAPSWTVAILLNGEKCPDLEFDDDWNVTNVLHLKGQDLAEGIHTIVFPVGSLMMNGNENAEEISMSFTIANGVVMEPVVEVAIVPAFIVPGEEYPYSLLNGNVSVEEAEAVTVSIDGIVPQEATYTIKTMIQVVDEESTSWVENETIAEGELSLHGAAGYAAFEDLMIFNQGERYVITIEAKAEGKVIATQSYEFNGATVPAALAMTLNASLENEVKFNGHNVPAVATVSNIKAQFANAVDVVAAHYAFSKMYQQETAEGYEWVAGVPFKQGYLSVNTICYTDFEKAVNFISGERFMLTVTGYDKEGNIVAEESAAFDGAGYPTVQFWNDFALVEGTVEIDLAETKSINVTVDINDLDGVSPEDDLYIEGMVYGKDGTQQPIFGFTDFEDGVDVALSRLTPGQDYNVVITKIGYGEIVDMDPETYMPIFANQFEDENGIASIIVSIKAEENPSPLGEIVAEYNEAGPVIVVTFKDQSDVAPSWTTDILMNGEKVEAELGMEWNEIYIRPGKLADGEYTIVFPAGSLMLNSSELNENEVSVTFTVGTPTSIDNVKVASEKPVKVIENGKIVIIKNGVKYNVKGMVIE